MATPLNGSKSGNGTAAKPAAEPGVGTTAIVSRAQALFDDLSFTAARQWKAANASR